MTRSGIAQRYAKALLQAALSAGKADEVFDDVQGLIALQSRDPSMRNFLFSPQVATEAKHALIDKVLKGRASDLTVEFLHILVDKKRIMFVADIAQAYILLYEKEKGIIEVTAITAVPLEDRLREKLLRTLESQTGKSIRLTHEINPHILGGMIVRMEDKLIDGSVRFQLEQLRRHLRETKVIRAGEAPHGTGS
jgi:F-type H+-transporting ATPase subunit delta